MSGRKMKVLRRLAEKRTVGKPEIYTQAEYKTLKKIFKITKDVKQC